MFMSVAFLSEVAELVARHVVDVVVVLGEIDPCMEIVPKPLAGAVVVRTAGSAGEITLASEAKNQGTAAIAVPLGVRVIGLIGLLCHLHVRHPFGIRASGQD